MKGGGITTEAIIASTGQEGAMQVAWNEKAQRVRPQVRVLWEEEKGAQHVEVKEGITREPKAVIVMPDPPGLAGRRGSRAEAVHGTKVLMEKMRELDG